ncbi:hypothetical protein [Ottowia thiooxydans]|uniref:hypothetical protein n=1 Tax=Ottowia thiooxydans TaxID=219182 RepID=UPI001B7F847E|nr:hypothetical protein [Ottowia thiooxydans]
MVQIGPLTGPAPAEGESSPMVQIGPLHSAQAADEHLASKGSVSDEHMTQAPIWLVPSHRKSAPYVPIEIWANYVNDINRPKHARRGVPNPYLDDRSFQSMNLHNRGARLNINNDHALPNQAPELFNRAVAPALREGSIFSKFWFDLYEKKSLEISTVPQRPIQQRSQQEELMPAYKVQELNDDIEGGLRMSDQNIVSATQRYLCDREGVSGSVIKALWHAVDNVQPHILGALLRSVEGVEFRLERERALNRVFASGKFELLRIFTENPEAINSVSLAERP